MSYGDWLAAPREKRFFEGSRLLFREIPGKNKRIQAAYIEETAYYGHSITPFVKSENLSNGVSLMFLLAIANSNLISFYGRLKLPNFGKDVFPKINPQDIKMLPVPTTSSDTQLILEKAANELIHINMELSSLTTRLLILLTAKYPNLNPTKKLSAWPDLSFAEFLKEVKKQKIAWSLGEQAEWLEHFTKEQAAARALQQEIDSTDREIDRLVHALYGLTAEEIALVEGQA